MLNVNYILGQGSSASIKAVTQKEQLQIMDDFKKGICNTLVATSVAEEGLDVGEVDLIICFDICTTNPTRFIQRIGRTGRKRQGNVIILATEGKELSNAKELVSNKDNANIKLFQHKDLKNAFYKSCPRLVPPEFNPKAIETFITIPEENKNKPQNQKKSGTKKKTDAPIRGTQDVRNFFQKVDSKSNTPESTSSNSRPQEIVVNISSDSEFEEGVRLQTGEDVDKMIKNLEKMKKNFGKKLPANVGPVRNIHQTLKSQTVSKEVKRYILEQNHDYVRDRFESFQVLSALGESSNILEMTEEEKQLKVEFEAIKTVFGSKFEVEEFLSTVTQKVLKPISNDEKCSNLFEGLEERDFFDDNTKFIEEMFSKIPAENLRPMAQETSNAFDDEGEEIEFVESKYLSQQSPMSQKKRGIMSTPLNNNLKRRMSLKFDESPILKKVCPETSLGKAFESTFEIPEEIVGKKLDVISEEVEIDKEKEDLKSISNLFDDDFTLPEENQDLVQKDKKDDPKEDLFDSDFEMENLSDVFEDDDCFEMLELEENKFKFASPRKIIESQIPVQLWRSNESLVDLEDIKQLCNKEDDKLNTHLKEASKSSEEEYISLSDSNSINDFKTMSPKSPISKKPVIEEVSPCVLTRRISKFRSLKSILAAKDSKQGQPTNDKENNYRPSTPENPIEISQSVYRSPFVKKLEITGDLSPSSIKKRPAINSLKNKLLRNEGTSSEFLAKENDESLIILRKKSSRRIESDDEEDLDSPIQRSKSKRPKILESDAEDSPFCRKNLLNSIVKSDVESPIVQKSKRPKVLDSDAEQSPFCRKRILNSIVESDVDSPVVPKCKKRIQHNFLEEEAIHSGDESSEGEEESMEDVSQYMLDSIIVNESDVKDDSNVNMQAFYLQSVR